jgi:hypothetical protein
MRGDERKSHAKTTVAIVVMVVIGYLALCWAGAVPMKYDIVRIAIGSPTGSNNTTEAIVPTPSTENVAKVSGLPDNTIVNLSVEPDNEITITFRCTHGEAQDMRVRAIVSDTNATVYLTANHRWKLIDNQTAVYTGRELVPYEDTASITLHIVGDSHTQTGMIHIIIDAPDCLIETNRCNGLVMVEA